MNRLTDDGMRGQKSVGRVGIRVADVPEHAAEANALMKALAHEGRMMILCHLSAGEKTVTQLEGLPGQRQAAVSQQLSRLRGDGLVTCRRDGKSRLYSVTDPRAAEVVALISRLFGAVRQKRGCRRSPDGGSA